uniref:Uncharacterized protein n=1 Tax=viral metagenome TaxID=1070528 RepID=A0A6C0H660_9ZZZZ
MIIFINGFPTIFNKWDYKSDKDYYKNIMKHFNNIQKPKNDKECWNLIIYKTKINKL